MSASSQAKIGFVSYRITKEQLPEVKQFYHEILKMNFTETKTIPNAVTYRFTFPVSKHNAGSCGVEFVASDNCKKPYPGQKGSDLYWKIGFALNDVDGSAHEFNKAQKQIMPTFDAPRPKGFQFRDVGYLTHLSDPCSFDIELLQTTFQGQGWEKSTKKKQELIQKHKTADNIFKQPLNTVNVGQITTRALDAKKMRTFYEEVLGMQLLCVEPTPGFDLYFFGYPGNESATPPNPKDLSDVSNREWLYQQPFTTIEVQVQRGNTNAFRLSNDENIGGFRGITLAMDEEMSRKIEDNANKKGEKVTKDGENMVVVDPDGCRYTIERL